MAGELIVTIPKNASFYTLYSDGLHCAKTIDVKTSLVSFHYPQNEAVFLYYTYPHHREAFLIRNTENGDVSLPSLSKKVSVLFTARASRVDKLKRAVSFLNVHTKGANLFSDDFYIRLWLILEKKGKLDYPALLGIAEKALEEKQP
jgi:hypothetical protein